MSFARHGQLPRLGLQEVAAGTEEQAKKRRASKEG